MGLVGAGLSYAATLDPDHPYLDRLRTAAEGYFYEAGPRGDGKGFGQSTSFLSALLSNLEALGLTDYPERPQYGEMLFDLPDGPWEIGARLDGHVVLRAPNDQDLQGSIRLQVDDHFSVEPAELPVNVARGAKAELPFALTLQRRPALFAGLPEVALQASFAGDAAMESAEASLRGAEGPIEDAIIAQAARFVAEEGGAVQERDDKAGDLGTSISHWNDEGHALTWQMEVERAGEYILALRHCAPHEGERLIRIEGHGEHLVALPATGGYGSNPDEWLHAVVRDEQGAATVFTLEAGTLTVTAINTDGRGRNLDYVALVPADG